jgi:ankyrin repeat protein
MALLLLGKGANPNLKERDGTTALDMAVDRGHREIATMLMKAGATQ